MADARMPSAAARLVMIAPPMLASDLLMAIVTASTRSSTPLWSEAPRPVLPSTPSPWASSTTSRAPWVAQMSASSESGASSPVIEYTPSTTTTPPARGGGRVQAGVDVAVDEQDVPRAADGRQQPDVGVDARRGEDGGLGAVV